MCSRSDIARILGFQRNHPIRKIFERSCELGLWRFTGERIWRAFGRSHRDRLNGKLQTIMERIEHGQHVFRAYWKHAWVKRYEKYSTFLRNEITSNNLRDFKLHKGLTYLGEVRTQLLQVLDRFAAGAEGTWHRVYQRPTITRYALGDEAERLF
jgi:hypothetical protein